jgi:hypothetical protein
MATIRRINDTYFIRSTTITKEDLINAGIGSWAYTKRITISEAAARGIAISFDVSIPDEHLAYLFKMVCEMEMNTDMG